MTWLLVFQCWSLTRCPHLFTPLCRAIRNRLKSTRSHFTLWPRLDSRHGEMGKIRLSFISSPKPKIHVTSRKRRNHNWGRNQPRGHQPGREAPVEVEHNLSFQVDVKFLPNKHQEGLANTFILKVNINLTSLVTGKLVLLSWDFFFPSLPYSFSTEGEEINPWVRNRCSEHKGSEEESEMAPQAGTLPHISKAKDKVRELKCTLEPWGAQQGQHRVQACLQKLGIIEHPHLPTETLPFFPSQEPLCTSPPKKLKKTKTKQKNYIRTHVRMALKMPLSHHHPRARLVWGLRTEEAL